MSKFLKEWEAVIMSTQLGGSQKEPDPMPTIDPATVATMQGRELEESIFRLFGIADCLTSPATFFTLLEAVRAKGWTSIDMHVSYIDGEACWTVNITCGRGPCELHGNPHDDWHGVEAEGHTLPLAFARAALLACLTEPAK